jgi:chromosomal replication initiator protein
MEISVIWQEFLTIVGHELGSRAVETWFKAVRPTSWDAHQKIVYLQMPNAFVKEWLERNYVDFFHQHLSRLLNERTITISFLDATKSPLTPAASLGEFRYEPARQQKTLPVIRNNSSRASVSPHYVFDSFIVGPTNNIAFQAAYAIAKHPGSLYNPLFIHAASGLGKTHLLQAIGNQISTHHKQAIIVYQPADRFVSEFVYALRSQKMRQFETKYKQLDVLLIDDIQCIMHKEQTQEAFFYIFNALMQANKQIVCSSDLEPRALTGLPHRMRSRLEGGLVVDMHMVDFTTKIAIIKKKALLHQVTINDDIAHYIAECVDSNIRELEGALIRVIACASLTKQELSLELAHRILRGTENKRTILPPDLHQIATKVAHHFDFTLDDLRSVKRHKELTIARHIAMYLMKKFTGRSLREIGHFLDRKDHSTVIHACEKIEYIRSKDPSLSHIIQAIEHAWC